ncbi:hypothetical protein HPB47_010958 [Ixodes persulcatus]|uniref:Uncharacterized protein n=1 Tax=Ixodes persulcatus TaxID=34615 RepID=A0AC60NXK7_IXOPE|nr:hypothetical protein HPB47_010958 [Ixodes persulcatus]
MQEVRCIPRWLPAALAREARRIRAIADDGSTTPCGVMFEESDSVVEKLIEGIRFHKCVYDTRKLEYRYTDRKGNARETIRELCGLPTEEANNAASIANSLTPLSQTYADILYHYRATRRTYPPPHPSLSTADARIWRRLQTNTYYNHLHLHHISPTNYPLNCPQCGEPNTTAHLVWTCPTNPPPPKSPTLEQWECVLQSCQLEYQEALISRARMAAAARGLPE